MKEYTAPNMTVSIFSDLTETKDKAAASVEYVDALRNDTNIAQKAQVAMTQMTQIIKFNF